MSAHRCPRVVRTAHVLPILTRPVSTTGAPARSCGLSGSPRVAEGDGLVGLAEFVMAEEPVDSAGNGLAGAAELGTAGEPADSEVLPQPTAVKRIVARTNGYLRMSV